MQEEQNIREDVGGLNNNQVQVNDYYSQPPLSKGQKIAVAVLAFFSFFVIIVWMMQFKQGISAPLNGAKTVVDYTTAETNDSENVDMTKDTDGDGLTDYNELNTYKTSPYLEDSDSDGFSDKVEIESSKDPNCPTGAICNAIATDTTASTTSITQGDKALNTAAPTLSSTTSQPTLNLPATAANSADLQKVLAGQVDAASLRRMLLQAGMDQATLDKISDDALMSGYKEILNK